MIIVYLHYSHLPLNEQLNWAAYEGRTEEVVRLLGRGADPNWQKGGWSALHWACYNNHPQMLTVLINSNANINIKDSDKYTHHSTSPVGEDPLSVCLSSLLMVVTQVSMYDNMCLCV